MISAETFLASFRRAIDDHHIRGRGFSKWRTKQVFADEVNYAGVRPTVGIVTALARELNLSFKREFHGLDAVFFSESVRVGRWTAPARVLLALEHENNPYSSHEEVYKLAWTTYPLKVMITYPRDQVHEASLLARYSRILNGSADCGGGQTGLNLVLFCLARMWRAHVWDGNSMTFQLLEEWRHYSVQPTIPRHSRSFEELEAEIDEMVRDMEDRKNSRQPWHDADH